MCAALFLVFTVFLTCRSPEKLLDTDRSFAPLVDGGAFTLKALPPIVQKVVVNFFAPHCPPCEKEVPELKK
ncbi:MAG TPA: hypothetical protein PLY93_03840, partial [Turneriella sp.]|nr:hypothetical protein [Turneriella sp.]